MDEFTKSVAVSVMSGLAKLNKDIPTRWNELREKCPMFAQTVLYMHAVWGDEIFDEFVIMYQPGKGYSLGYQKPMTDEDLDKIQSADLEGADSAERWAAIYDISPDFVNMILGEYEALGADVFNGFFKSKSTETEFLPDHYRFVTDLTAADLVGILSNYPANTPVRCCGDSYIHIHVSENPGGKGYTISLDTDSLSDLYPEDKGPNKEV